MPVKADPRASPRLEVSQIKHTQDLLVAIASGEITPDTEFQLTDTQSAGEIVVVKALVRAIYDNPHKAPEEPYFTQRSDGVAVKFSPLDKKKKPFAPSIYQLPGTKEIMAKWIEEKLYSEPCSKCGKPTLVLTVSIGSERGYLSWECGKVRLDFLTLADFLSSRERKSFLF